VLAVVFERFLAVLILVPGRYLKRFVPGFSFLVFGSWASLVRALLVRALLVRALLVLDIAGPGLGLLEGFRLSHLLRVVAGWVFKGVFCRRVCAGILCGR
jgi:hypothetical protein